MINTINIDTNGLGSFFGALAQPYAYKTELRTFVDTLVDAAQKSGLRHFVIEGTTVRAVQHSHDAALEYMSPERIIVSIETA